MIDLEKLKELAKGATPVPWQAGSSGYEHHLRTVAEPWDAVGTVTAPYAMNGGSVVANAAYIVAACNAVPALVEALEVAIFRLGEVAWATDGARPPPPRLVYKVATCSLLRIDEILKGDNDGKTAA